MGYTALLVIAILQIIQSQITWTRPVVEESFLSTQELLQELKAMVEKDEIDEIISSGTETNTTTDEDTVKVELDMIFTRRDWEKLQRQQARERHHEAVASLDRQKRKAARTPLYQLWTNAKIPYKIDSQFSDREKAEIRSAMGEWEQYTCVDFEEHPANSLPNNYVDIINTGGCSSYVGMCFGAQNLTLGERCEQRSVILHELGHAIGLVHEHNRYDRDNYVEIQTDNIQTGQEGSFSMLPVEVVDTHGVPYDYLSIMHYGKRAFSKDKRITIRTLDPNYQNRIGRVEGLSFEDIKIVNLMYNCSAAVCARRSCPGDGFLGKDCKCWCKGSPLREC